jgi:hypothetical protein
MLIFLLIATPPSLLFHELGHGFAAKSVRGTTVGIAIGTGKLLWQGKLLGIDMMIYQLFIVNSHAYYHHDRSFSSFEKIYISVMGPCFSLLLAFFFFVLFTLFHMEPGIYILFLFNLWIGIVNFIPFKIGQKQSDGYTICKQLIKQWKKGI